MTGSQDDAAWAASRRFTGAL